MLIQSTRFGRLHVEHQEMLLMPQGLIGFETCRHWILLTDHSKSRIAWLQSVGLANVALPVVSPKRYVPDFRVHVNERQLNPIHLRSEDQLFILAVVSKNGMALTMNLKSPILFNATRQLAVQVVCTHDAPLALPIGLMETAKHPSKAVA